MKRFLPTGLLIGFASSVLAANPLGDDLRSVADFGAAGDGKADDTKALQAAIDAIPAAGGIVFLPVGIYRTTAPIRLRPQLRLMGATRRSWGSAPGSGTAARA